MKKKKISKENKIKVKFTVFDSDKIQFLDTKVFIQNSDSLYTSYFYYMIKTCI